MPVELIGEQYAALTAAKNGRNLFITGPAGVGKSEVLHRIREALPDAAVTATTGVATVNVQGDGTIYSWAGIGLGKDQPPTIIRKLKRQVQWAAEGEENAGTRVLRTKTLIIDEISMLPHAIFVLLDKVFRGVRNCPRPFGGMQLIVVGDFYQLPPVPSDYSRCPRCGADAVERDDGLLKCGTPQDMGCYTAKWDARLRFCFDDDLLGNNLWNKCRFQTVQLRTVHRQDDRAFVDALHRIRVGDVRDEDMELLARCDRPLPEDDGIKPTKLETHNYSVDYENDSEYQKLRGAEYTYEAVDISVDRATNRPVPECRMLMMLQRHSPCKGDLDLKVGAQVMLVCNLDVALGLCNGTRGTVIGFTNPEARGEQPMPTPKAVPIVRFVVRDGGHLDIEVGPHTWSKETMVRVASRTQIPLIHAWATTVHKSQGMTLTKVEMDLTEAFTEGQVYVALSRAASLGGLRVRLDPGKIAAHPSVRAFYDNLG